MRIGELARSAGVTVKAVRYYEAAGLIRPGRMENGYRDYDERQVRLVREIHELGALGIRVEATRPFLDCLIAGNGQADDCPDSVTAYRDAIVETDERIAALTARRNALAALLASADARGIPRCEYDGADPTARDTQEQGAS